MTMNRRKFVCQTAGLGVALAASGWHASRIAFAADGIARGTVLADDRPLANVRVSDGYHVVLTDSAGEYRLPVSANSGPFVFVCTPSGYWGEQYYLPISEAITAPAVFRLQAVEKASSYKAIYLTDLHLGEGKKDESYARFAASLQELKQLNPSPAICLAGGDISLQHHQGDRYVRMMDDLKIPVRNGIGNHEMFVNESEPRGDFRRLFGPTYYSFDVGEVHFVVLDGCKVEGTTVTGSVSPSELHWLREDLRRVPDGMKSVLAIHIPLISDMPERCGTTSAKMPGWVVSNAEEVIDVLVEFGVDLVLQGHLHENQHTVHKGIHFVESISACGRWWGASGKDRELGVSGEPRGYRILDIEGTRIRHRFQSSAESRIDKIGEIIDNSPTRQIKNSEKVIVNVFDAISDATVLARIDDGMFHPLTLEKNAPPLHGTIPPAHHWSWINPEEQPLNGRHRMQFRVTNNWQPDDVFEEFAVFG